MKRFHFPLGRVLALRQTQAELEAARLQRLDAERSAINRERLELAESGQAADRAVLGSAALEAHELAALTAHRSYVSKQDRKLQARSEEVDRRIAAQVVELTEARRRVRLLEKLRERRRAEWQAACDREQEETATEVFLARWRERRGN